MQNECPRDGLRTKEQAEWLKKQIALLHLTVSNDDMTVCISPQEDILPNVTPETIKNLLELVGICYGVVEDHVLSAHLTNASSHERPWEVARGSLPYPGKDPVIRYHFNTNPLTVGSQDETGKMDFKNRGEVPQVAEGAVLAEIDPGIPGTAGSDVFGKPIPPPGRPSLRLQYGQGARLSNDRLKVLARIAGRPELMSDGKICVFPDLVISGDVGYATGHVQFDGDVEVKGAVQEGFQVRARSLRAREINKAEVVVAKDVVVYEGIIGARVKADGKLQCKHVHTSTMEVLGDLVVENTLFDSTITTNGQCLLQKGRILSSRISAKKGIEAGEIGSQASEACDLQVGVDGFLKNLLQKISRVIELTRGKQEAVEAKLSENRAAYQKLEEDIVNLADEETRLRTQIADLGEKIQALIHSGQPHQEVLPKAKAVHGLMEKKLSQIMQTVEDSFTRQEVLDQELEEGKAQMEAISENIRTLEARIVLEKEKAAEDKCRPVMKVTGSVHAGTVIRGPQAVIELKDRLQNVTIKEMRNVGEDKIPTFSMEIFPNR